jgi:mannose-6-phosphate isomerase
LFSLLRAPLFLSHLSTLSLSFPPQVASLAAAGGTAIDPSAPYAELWMGTHPSGPSEIINEEKEGEDSSLLQSFLDENAPAAVGAPSAERFGATTLPFLFKVLSVQTALSIQSHPDKKLAERLHAEKPEVREGRSCW